MGGTEHTDTGHLVRLGDSGWRLWRDAALRGAGFPVTLVRDLTAPALAEAADAHRAGTATAEDYQAQYDRAVAEMSAALRRTAAEPRFREAVTWQNRTLVRTCLDKVAAGEPRNSRGRGHELAVAGYVQRYALKNDTIGFTGPVAWARLLDRADEGPARLAARPGPSLLARRSVYLETWAVDAVARALSADPEILPWLVPRLDPAMVLDGDVVHRPDGLPVALEPAEAAVLARVDGVRTVRRILADLADTDLWELRTPRRAHRVFRGLAEQGLLRLSLEGPVEARPEVTLRERLRSIEDPGVRDRACAVLDRVTTRAAEVARAAGDADRLAEAIDGLNATFTEITGAQPTRRHGAMYAGRTLVYEDTMRDIEVVCGPRLLAELSRPLGLVLDSARWLAHRIGQEYQALFQRVYDRLAPRHPSGAVPLARLVGAVTPQLYVGGAAPEPVRTAMREFQDRWRRLLDPSGEGLHARRHHVAYDSVAERARELFPAVTPLWATAMHHAPDLMLAASSPEAVERGDYTAVLGELHLAYNPFENRVLVEQHPDPAWLCAADAADHRGRRVYRVPSKDASAVTSRAAPPSAMLAADSVYWTFRDPAVDPPGRVVPLAAMTVHRQDGDLVVRDATSSFQAPLLEVVGELLSEVGVNSFRPLPAARHRPRVTLDRLVFARESWHLPAEELLVWAAVKSEPDRFLAARAWRAAHGLPERLFYRTPTEDKPIFVDFSSIALVNLFARAVRRAAESDAAEPVAMTEMLPGPEQTWLRDAEGNRYTCELRVVAADPLRHGRARW